MDMSKQLHTPEEEPRQVATEEQAGKIHLGLAGNYDDTEETRFFLTPEACGLLTSAGIHIMMEQGAAIDISFPDKQYAEYGVEISDRDTVLRQDIVLSYHPLRIADVKKMRDGASLLCMMTSDLFDKELVGALQRKNITLGTFDNMYSFNEEPVFANIIDEINGRAAIMYAQEAMSFLGEGKGVLLAGVGGINPCEVVVIGAGTEVQAAASAAMSAGALVTLMNNDISELQIAQQACGPGLLTSAMHPRVLYNKVKSADIIIMGSCTNQFEMPKNLSIAMKDSVYFLDLREVEPSVSVPRTVAMALSNVLVNFFDEMVIKNGLDGMIASTFGVQSGIVIYKGTLVDKLVGSYTHLPAADISVMLTAAN